MAINIVDKVREERVTRGEDEVASSVLMKMRFDFMRYGPVRHGDICTR